MSSSVFDRILSCFGRKSALLRVPKVGSRTAYLGLFLKIKGIDLIEFTLLLSFSHSPNMLRGENSRLSVRTSWKKKVALFA